MEKFDLPRPVNVSERYAYATAKNTERMLLLMEAMCNMMSSLIEAYGKVNNLATTNETMEIKEVKEEQPKRTTRKRSTKKKGE